MVTKGWLSSSGETALGNERPLDDFLARTPLFGRCRSPPALEGPPRIDKHPPHRETQDPAANTAGWRRKTRRPGFGKPWRGLNRQRRAGFSAPTPQLSSGQENLSPVAFTFTTATCDPVGLFALLRLGASLTHPNLRPAAGKTIFGTEGGFSLVAFSSFFYSALLETFLIILAMGSRVESRKRDFPP